MESTSARDLDRRLAQLVRSERHLAVQFVVELAAFARQELHRELGYTSLFHYCVRQLGLSKSSAFRRSETARLIARFPVIGERLAEGRLAIRALVELREVLTDDNHLSLLARAEGKSQEEAQLLAVELKPKPIPRDVVRILSATPAGTAATARPATCAAVPAGTNWPAGPHAPPNPCAAVPAGTNWPAGPHAPPNPCAAVPAGTNPASRPPEIVRPLTPALRRLNVTVSAEFIAELEQVRAALSHKCPDGDFERVVREAFKLVLERDRKRKALTDRPRTPRKARERVPRRKLAPEPDRAPGQAWTQTRAGVRAQPATQPWPPAQPWPPTQPLPSTHPLPAAAPGHGRVVRGNDRYIPAAVRRAVWQRDRGRCTWPMSDGRVCGSTHRLELDHDLEVALGGKSTLDNIRVLCKSHNLLKAEQHLGRAWMAQFRRVRPTERDTS